MQNPNAVTILERGVRELFPGYFALVMATGIVSIAAYLLRLGPVAWVLFGVDLVAYAVLWLLTVARLLKYLPRLMRDLLGHNRGPGFLTMVAATCIVGSQFVLFTPDFTPGFVLWLLAVILWFALLYIFLAAVMVREKKPDLEAGLHGGWLVAVVATQSVSVLGTLLAAHMQSVPPFWLFFTLAMYLLGCALYLLIISLIFYRLVFFTLTPQEFTPAYWINMGALAITTLAGSELILAASRWGFLETILPFLKGFTLFFWATGTWWIPLLLILEIWRHGYKRYPLRYDPRYWDIIFPLGMYVTATFELSKAMTLPFLSPIDDLIYLTLLAWAITFVGLLHRLWVALVLPSLDHGPGVPQVHDSPRV